MSWLYGQEINLITSSIARMNMFMHGIEEFDVFRGDTLANPGFMEYDELKKFNVILANPPYSIKRWDQKSFENDLNLLYLENKHLITSQN